MAKYAILTPHPDAPEGAMEFVLLETDKGISRYSKIKDDDDEFAERYKRSKNKPTLEYLTTGYARYSLNVGNYSGEDKKRVDALIAKMRYNKVRVVKD